MLNLILFGPPGSGKGTQAANMIEKYNLLHISTGDLFRSEITNQTELGRKAKSYMDKGELVPDEVTISMLAKKVDENPHVKGYIFDGFPRTVPQAEALDAMLAEKHQHIAALIALEVEDNELERRLLKRGESSGRADDVDTKVIRNRIAIYKNNTTPVAEYYATAEKTHKIDGIGTIEDIFEKIASVIENL